MDHSEEITESKFNTGCSISGSKIIDILDCIMADEGPTGPRQQAVNIKNKTECHNRAPYRCVPLCPIGYTDRGKVTYLGT
jgi:hypothetical protein